MYWLLWFFFFVVSTPEVYPYDLFLFLFWIRSVLLFVIYMCMCIILLKILYYECTMYQINYKNPSYGMSLARNIHQYKQKIARQNVIRKFSMYIGCMWIVNVINFKFIYPKNRFLCCLYYNAMKKVKQGK